MSGNRAIKIALSTACMGLALLFMSLPARAQCAMCKTAVTGSPDAGRLSQSLNSAVLILLIPPVLIFCGIFILAYRRRNARGTESESSSLQGGGTARWFKASGSARQSKEQNKREAGGAPA